MVSPRKRILADRPRLVRRQGASKLGAVKLRPQCDAASGEQWYACFRNRRAVELLGLECRQGSGATALRQTLHACQQHHRAAVNTPHARWHNMHPTVDEPSVRLAPCFLQEQSVMSNLTSPR